MATISAQKTLVLSCLDTIHDFAKTSGRSNLKRDNVMKIIEEVLKNNSNINVVQVITELHKRSHSLSKIEHNEYNTVRKSLKVNQVTGVPEIVEAVRKHSSKFIVDQGANTGCNTKTVVKNFASWFDDNTNCGTSYQQDTASLNKVDGELLLIDTISQCAGNPQCIKISYNSKDISITDTKFLPNVKPYSEVIFDILGNTGQLDNSRITKLKNDYETNIFNKLGLGSGITNMQYNRSMLLMDLKRAGDSLQIQTITPDKFFVTADYMAATIALYKRKNTLLTTKASRKPGQLHSDKIGYIYNFDGTSVETLQLPEYTNLNKIIILLEERNELFDELINTYNSTKISQTDSGRIIKSVDFEKTSIEPIIKTIAQKIDKIALVKVRIDNIEKLNDANLANAINNAEVTIKNAENDAKKAIDNVDTVVDSAKMKYNRATVNGATAPPQLVKDIKNDVKQAVSDAINKIIILANLKTDLYIYKINDALANHYSVLPDSDKLSAPFDKLKNNNIFRKLSNETNVQTGGVADSFKIDNMIETIEYVLNLKMVFRGNNYVLIKKRNYLIQELFNEIEHLRKLLVKNTDYGKYFDINDPIMSITGLVYIELLLNNSNTNIDIISQKNGETIYSFKKMFEKFKNSRNTLTNLKERILFMHYRYIQFIKESSRKTSSPSKKISKEQSPTMKDLSITDTSVEEIVFNNNYWNWNNKNIDKTVLEESIKMLNIEIDALNKLKKHKRETKLLSKVNIYILTDYYKTYLHFFKEIVKFMPEYMYDNTDISLLTLIDYISGKKYDTPLEFKFINTTSSIEEFSQSRNNVYTTPDGKKRKRTDTGTVSNIKKNDYDTS